MLFMCIFVCQIKTIFILYQLGKRGSKRISSIERYDPLLNVWKYCTPMKKPIASPVVCSLNGRLYLIGEAVIDVASGEEPYNTFQCYNPVTDTWKELTPMPLPRVGSGICSFNEFIYVIGGMDTETSSVSDRVEYYNPVEDKWYPCNNMIKKRHRPGISVLNNRIYACGGDEGSNVYHSSCECYNSSTNEWEICTNMTEARSWLSCATLRLQNPLLDIDGYEAQG